MYSFAICTSSRVKFLFRFYAHSLIKLFIFLWRSFKSALYILNTSPLWDIYFAIVFSQSVAWESHYILTNRNFLIQNPWKCEPVHRVCWRLQSSSQSAGEGRKLICSSGIRPQKKLLSVFSPISWFSCILLIPIIFFPMLLAFCSYCNFRQKHVFGRSIIRSPDID